MGVLTSLEARPILVHMTSTKLYISEINTCGRCPDVVHDPGYRACCGKMDIQGRIDVKYNVSTWQPPPEWCPLPDKNTQLLESLRGICEAHDKEYPDEPHDCGHEVFEYAHKKITGRYSK